MDETLLINNPDNIWIGKEINKKYKIVSLLGSGASSDVYLCENMAIGNNAVVKIVNLEYADKYKLHKEIEILAKLHHPNMPYIIDHYSDEKYLYIFETYIEGISLEQKLKDCLVIDEERASKYFEQLLDIFKYLHNIKPNPIVYRDIKPANILVNNDEKLYIIDFGISKLYRKDEKLDILLGGTKGYAAPEQWDTEKSVDKRADIYSLGALMYKLLTGESFKGDADNLEQNINLSEDFKAIIKKCLIKNEDKRYQSIEDIIKDFEQLKYKNKRVPTGKKVFLIDGAQGVGKSTVISGIANIYSKNGIQTAVLDMSDKLGISLFWDIQKTQLMKYVVDTDNYEAIKKIAIKPNKNLYIYKMGSINEDSVIAFINKLLKFVDVILIECNKNTTKKLYDQTHEIILITKQEEKYMFATMYILNKYIKSKVYLDNLRILVNDYEDIIGEEEHLINLINKRLKVSNKSIKRLLKIPSIKRLNYIENLQKGSAIFKNDERAQNAFYKLSEELYEAKKASGFITFLEEGIKKWLTQGKMKKS